MVQYLIELIDPAYFEVDLCHTADNKIACKKDVKKL